MMVLAIVGTPIVLLTLAATCACLCGARGECPLLMRESYDPGREAQVLRELEAVT